MKNLRQAKQHRRLRHSSQHSSRHRSRHSSRHSSRHRVFDHFGVELGACKESDTPGKMVFFWRDGPGGLNDRGIAGYAYNDEQHQIAQRIGPEMQPFLAGLSSDPHFSRGRGLLTRSEVTTWWILYCFLGPLAIYWLLFINSK
jgi:hypothetical protein